MQLREAIKTLSSTELYTPTITRFRETDRIATGYYDGLIRVSDRCLSFLQSLRRG